MTPVYSTQLIVVQGLTSAATKVCADGYVMVLRDLDVFYNGLLEASVHMEGSVGQTIYYNGFAAGGNPQYASWRGRQVLNAGESVTIVCDQAQDVSLSGYLLTTP